MPRKAAASTPEFKSVSLPKGVKVDHESALDDTITIHVPRGVIVKRLPHPIKHKDKSTSTLIEAKLRKKSAAPKKAPKRGPDGKFLKSGSKEETLINPSRARRQAARLAKFGSAK